jgi:hypothetical protein
MAQALAQTRDWLASRLNFLINTPEVLRLITDITTCSVEWLDHPDLEALEASGGLELFPCFTAYLQKHQSLTLAPCATIKLDAQDNPYIGSMLHSAAALRRCSMPDEMRKEAVIRAWRLFKRLLYYSVEGERLFTGFAFLNNFRPLEYYQQRLPALLWFHEANYTSLELGLQALRQFLLNANGRSTFLALYDGRIVGLLKVVRGAQRQLTTPGAWRSTLPLATISHRVRVSF